MIWANPWAWLGLGTIAIPILIHLLGRDRAPRHSFPSLRFIEIAELPPTRRTRLHDLLLLATRVAILVGAVAGLAQPLLLLASRKATVDDRLARAIIIDTSASMLRQTVVGARALDSARNEAQRFANEAHTSITVETASPQSAMEGAIGWLKSQQSQGELVVVSDFQTGVLDSAIVASVPSAIGIRAVEIAAVHDARPLGRALLAKTNVASRVDFANGASNATWTAQLGNTPEPRIEIHAADSVAGSAVSTAAKTVGVVQPIDTTARVAVLFRGAPDRDTLARRAARVRSQRLIELVTRIRDDSLLASTRDEAVRGSGDSSLARFGPIIASDAADRIVAVAAEDTAGAGHRLLVFSNDSAGSLRSAALVAALRRALSVAPPVGELDPSTIPASVIASWQRAPSATPTRDNMDSANGPSDGRWLWAFVLVLLGVEAWLRRERRAAAVRVQEKAHDRAA